MVTLSLIQKVRVYNGEKAASSINGAGTAGYPPAKEWNWTHNSHHKQKLTQNLLVT